VLQCVATLYNRSAHTCQSSQYTKHVGSLKLQVSFAEYRLVYRALLQKRPMISRSLLLQRHTLTLSFKPRVLLGYRICILSWKYMLRCLEGCVLLCHALLLAIYIYIYIYVYICICIYIHMYVHIYIYIHMHTYIDIYIYICILYGSIQ